jgi:hypothetical protein
MLTGDSQTVQLGSKPLVSTAQMQEFGMPCVSKVRACSVQNCRIFHMLLQHYRNRYVFMPRVGSGGTHL